MYKRQLFATFLYKFSSKFNYTLLTRNRTHIYTSNRTQWDRIWHAKRLTTFPVCGLTTCHAMHAVFCTSCSARRCMGHFIHVAHVLLLLCSRMKFLSLMRCASKCVLQVFSKVLWNVLSAAVWERSVVGI